MQCNANAKLPIPMKPKDFWHYVAVTFPRFEEVHKSKCFTISVGLSPMIRSAFPFGMVDLFSFERYPLQD